MGAFKDNHKDFEHEQAAEPPRTRCRGCETVRFGTLSMPISRAAWLTWERQRRNRSLSAKLGVELFELEAKGPRWRRYPHLLRRTFALLVRRSPQLIFVQNPSIVLATCVALYGRIRRTPVVVDAHNAGVHPNEGRSKWLQMWAHLVFRLASRTIVTNSALAEYVTRHGGRPFVLQDPFPTLDIPERPSPSTRGVGHKVVFICTWAADEPYVEVLRAAERLAANNITVIITGNSRGREAGYGHPLPRNVVLTGYVPEENYIALLAQADVLVDLTTRENCLVCGAYEAAALGKPGVLSNTQALRDYFTEGFVFTDNTAVDIAKAIKYAVEHRERLTQELDQYRAAADRQWEQRCRQLKNELLTLMR